MDLHEPAAGLRLPRRFGARSMTVEVAEPVSRLSLCQPGHDALRSRSAVTAPIRSQISWTSSARSASWSVSIVERRGSHGPMHCQR